MITEKPYYWNKLLHIALQLGLGRLSLPTITSYSATVSSNFHKWNDASDHTFGADYTWCHNFNRCQEKEKCYHTSNYNYPHWSTVSIQTSSISNEAQFCCYTRHINAKAQGQTLMVSEVHLEKPCFAHGQLQTLCMREMPEIYIYLRRAEERII